MLRALAANTSIKMAARLPSADRTAMARDMNTTPDFIRDQTVGSFACFMRGETRSAISTYFPLNALKRFGAMTAAERSQVRDRNRTAYANPIGSSESSPQSPADEAADPGSRRSRRDPDAP